MAAKTLPSQDVLNQLLRYEKETGKLFWRERPEKFFTDGQQSAAHNAAIWNARFAGKEIVTALPSGNLYTSISKVKMLVHRMIWKMIYGVEPEVIDHIDGNPRNNVLSNLRDTTQLSNGRNMKMRKNNSSGHMGVRFDTRLNKWIAVITPSGKKVHLGVFLSFEEAVAARKTAERKFDFHPNHGRVAASA